MGKAPSHLTSDHSNAGNDRGRARVIGKWCSFRSLAEGERLALASGIGSDDSRREYVISRAQAGSHWRHKKSSFQLNIETFPLCRFGQDISYHLSAAICASFQSNIVFLRYCCLRSVCGGAEVTTSVTITIF